MACWPSSGLTRVAYEIKVSRSDFLNELKDPGKRQAGMKLANEFWYVAPGDVIRPDEVPEGCGWLLVDAGGLKTKKAAPHRDVEPLPMTAVASILRHVCGRQERMTSRELKAFKFAGKELNVADVLALGKEENERWLEADVARKLSDALATARATMPEVRLTRAVSEAMGRAWYNPQLAHSAPSPDAFRLWFEGQRLGVPPDAVAALADAREGLERASARLKAAEESLRASQRPERNEGSD